MLKFPFEMEVMNNSLYNNNIKKYCYFITFIGR